MRRHRDSAHPLHGDALSDVGVHERLASRLNTMTMASAIAMGTPQVRTVQATDY